MAGRKRASKASAGGGSEKPEIIEPIQVPVTYADWFLSVFETIGIVHINLGTLDGTRIGANATPSVVVTTKLRVSHDFAIRFHRLLGQALGLAPPTPEDAPNPPPSNLMH
jgi:hypothetical protein